MAQPESTHFDSAQDAPRDKNAIMENCDLDLHLDEPTRPRETALCSWVFGGSRREHKYKPAVQPAIDWALAAVNDAIQFRKSDDRNGSKADLRAKRPLWVESGRNQGQRDAAPPCITSRT
jgi:hypothetical protein